MGERPGSPVPLWRRSTRWGHSGYWAEPIRGGWRGNGTLRRAAMMILLVAALDGCGGGGAGGEDPLALEGEPSDACSQAIKDGHNAEAAGRAAPFLPSVRACGSLAEWTAAAKGFGIDLKGREAQFVDNTCNAATEEVKALKICQEAKAAVSDPRRIP